MGSDIYYHRPVTERQRELFAWIVLSLVALLLGHIVASILGPVLGFVAVVLLQLAGALHAPDAVSTAVAIVLGLLLTAARCAMIGFAYRAFFDDPWRKAGLYAWAVIVVWSVLPAPRLPTSVWFYASTLVSGAAALAGAWYAQEQRHDRHVRAVRDALLGFLRID